MADKEGASLLPTSSTSSVKSVKAEDRRFHIRMVFQWLHISTTFQWLHISTTALIVCWIAFHSFQQDSPPVMTSDVMRHLKTNQEVRKSSCAISESLLKKIDNTGSRKKAAGKRAKDHRRRDCCPSQQRPLHHCWRFRRAPCKP